MNQAQIAALEGVVGRALTAGEKATLDPLVAARNDMEIAHVLSTGRTKHGPTQIGTGTVLAVMGECSGAFLDAITTLGENDRNVYWGMDPVRRGVLDLSIPAARAYVQALKVKLPDFTAPLDLLLAVGVIADPVDVPAVSMALNKAEGRITL